MAKYKVCLSETLKWAIVKEEWIVEADNILDAKELVWNGEGDLVQQWVEDGNSKGIELISIEKMED